MSISSVPAAGASAAGAALSSFGANLLKKTLNMEESQVQTLMQGVAQSAPDPSGVKGTRLDVRG